MTKLTDMAHTKEELKERNAPCTLSYPGESEKYPYGLNVSLNEDQMKKLGIKLPKTGSFVMLTAKCKVISTSSNDTTGRGQSQRMELQMQQMAVDVGASSMEDAVAAGVDEAGE